MSDTQLAENYRDGWAKHTCPTLPPRPDCSGGHECRFSGHKRTSPAGGNRHNVSVIVAECSCGKLHAKFPEKLTYWDRRWIARVNHRIDCPNTPVRPSDATGGSGNADMHSDCDGKLDFGGEDGEGW